MTRVAEAADGFLAVPPFFGRAVRFDVRRIDGYRSDDSGLAGQSLEYLEPEKLSAPAVEPVVNRCVCRDRIPGGQSRQRSRPVASSRAASAVSAAKPPSPRSHLVRLKLLLGSLKNASHCPGGTSSSMGAAAVGRSFRCNARIINRFLRILCLRRGDVLNRKSRPATFARNSSSSTY